MKKKLMIDISKNNLLVIYIRDNLGRKIENKPYKIDSPDRLI